MKNEKTENRTDREMTGRRTIQRRDFFKIIGGGIIVYFIPREVATFSPSAAQQRRGLPSDYNAFLSIGEDGTVSCYTGKIEMGQGVITSLPQMMADELNVPVEKIKIVMGDTDLCPWDAGTWGSETTRGFGPSMRAAAAEARAVLVGLAAVKFGVPESQLEVRDGVVTDLKNSKNTVTYGALAKGKRIEKFLDKKPGVESYKNFTYIGKSYKRADAHLKVTGAAQYTGDLKLPGMLFAKILRPPSHGAKLKSADTAGADKIAGTQVVRDGDFIAVLHKDIEQAEIALNAVKAEWTFDEMPVNENTIHDFMLKVESDKRVVGKHGDIEAGRKSSVKTFDNKYSDPYLAHSPIEPHTALAKIEDGKLTVWASSQSPFGLKDEIVQTLGYSPDKVRVIVPFVGGGFGGKIAHQQGIEAARIAKLSGKPVMLAWTRDEEFFYDTFHPAGVIKISSGIDAAGKITFWDNQIYFSGTRSSETLYDVPNDRKTEYSEKENGPRVHPFFTGAWRAPNANTNVFAREVQIDIMAAAAGIDPLQFRLSNLKNEKMIACLKSVAEKFGYKPAKGPSGRGIGIACGIDAGTYIAQIVQVKTDKKTGKIKVERVVSSQDMGLCVNPEGALIQMEGSVTMALGYTLSEELSFEGGNIKNRGFDTYTIPHFTWLPKIENVILDRQDQPPQGGGEPAIIGIGAAVANAFFDATGARLFRMPFTAERVLEALKKA